MKIRLPTVINFVLLIALAAMGTYWVIQWTAQNRQREPLAAIPTGDRVTHSQPLDAPAAARMFGATVGGFVESGRLKLTGIISEGGKGAGVALLAMDGQPAAAYRVGDTIDADLKLVHVGADRVVLRGGGGDREIRMPERAAPTGIVPVR